MRAHDILPDHANQVQINSTAIRKGSVGALLANAVAFRDPQLRAFVEARP